jgi:hypothetical protein
VAFYDSYFILNNAWQHRPVVASVWRLRRSVTWHEVVII